MIIRNLAVVALAGAAFLISGCGGDGGCEPVILPGAQLIFNDRETGLPVCGVSYRISDGDYTEEGTLPLEGSHCNQISVLQERPGSYSLEVAKDGYAPITMDVEIFSDRCHVITERLDIDLESL